MNHLYNLSNRIAKDYDLASVETVKIDEMKRKSKPVAKAVADVNWAQFILFLEYKCLLNGHYFQKINQWLASSKTCCVCGNKQTIPLNIRQYTCICGNDIHRDINAAININNWGLQQWNLTFKSGQYLPKVPVDSLCEILSNDCISSSDLKQEAIAH